MTNNILIISPVPTHPCLAGNRARILHLGAALKDRGYNVSFAHIGFEMGDESAMKTFWGEDNYNFIPYTKPKHRFKGRLKRIKHIFDKHAYFKYSIDEWYDSSIDLPIKSLCTANNIDTVIVEYVFFSKCLINFDSGTRKLLDTHDVFSDRHEKFLAQGKKPIWFSTTKKQEAKALNRADYVIAIQKEERDFFSELTQRPVITTGHPVFVTAPSSPKRHNTLLFMGSDNLNNIDAVNYFLVNIFPLILKQKPDVELLLVGTICNRIDEQDNVIKLGKVDDLDEIYQLATVVINPIQFGTGLKIKNIEALGYSKPLVTTTIGAAGMEAGINHAFLIGDNPNEFTKAVLSILSSKHQQKALSEGAYDFALVWNKEVMNDLIAVL